MTLDRVHADTENLGLYLLESINLVPYTTGLFRSTGCGIFRVEEEQHPLPFVSRKLVRCPVLIRQLEIRSLIPCLVFHSVSPAEHEDTAVLQREQADAKPRLARADELSRNIWALTAEITC